MGVPLVLDATDQPNKSGISSCGISVPISPRVRCVDGVYRHLNSLSARFHEGLDCIFHLRGLPYSLCTFPVTLGLIESRRGLAADYLIPRIITRIQEILHATGFPH